MYSPHAAEKSPCCPSGYEPTYNVRAPTAPTPHGITEWASIYKPKLSCSTPAIDHTNAYIEICLYEISELNPDIIYKVFEAKGNVYFFTFIVLLLW